MRGMHWRRSLAGAAAGFLLAGAAQGAGFQTVTEKQWNADAVRRVLATFAYGGQATESQVARWARMAPADAVAQMLTFEEHNFLLSPDDGDAVASQPGTMKGLRSFWASNHLLNDTPLDRRSDFAENYWQVSGRTWLRATMTRGLNPFRQRIGLWETNYHLAVNTGAGVENDQLEPYYDTIMTGLAANKAYHRVMADAASSAAVAMQYGHRLNRIVDGACECNQDFAREFHQLFFGILGHYNPKVHETVTVPNTARALTDMAVNWTEEEGGWDDAVNFGTDYHDRTTMRVLQEPVQGRTARQSITAIAEVAIRHPESLQNLPVKIIAGLADDNLDETKIQAIREAWAAMPSKNLLDFIRAYAVSTTFHNPTRFRYLSSIDRQMKIAVQFTTRNREAALDLYQPEYGLHDEDVRVFAPKHNVFGGQTGTDAVGAAMVFQNNFARSTEYNWMYRTSGESWGRTFEKDFRRVIPAGETDSYRVDLVAEMLWHRLIGSLRTFGPLERAYVYSYLAKRLDAATALGFAQDHAVTTADLDAKAPEIAALAATRIALAATDADTRDHANSAIAEAIAFIVATPYMFVEEGR